MSCALKTDDFKIAVLICVYAGDRKEWFRQAVTSILGQSVKGSRIYLGVDGPLDPGMEDFLADHRNWFYKIVRNPRNEGLTKTLNRLIGSLEDEDFVFRLDADDLCFADRFEKQIGYLWEHPDVEVLGSAVIEIDRDGERIFQREYPQTDSEIRKKIFRANPLAHSSVCFRNSFFDKIKSYPERVTFNQDLALWFEGLKQGVRFANLPEPLVYMRVDRDFYRRRSRKRALDEARIYFRGIYEQHGISLRYVFPAARFLFRLFPVPVIRFLYSSSLRKKLT